MDDSKKAYLDYAKSIGEEKIPHYDVQLGEEELKQVSEVVRSNWLSEGKKTREFEDKFRELVGTKYAYSDVMTPRSYKKFVDDHATETDPEMYFGVVHQTDARIQSKDMMAIIPPDGTKTSATINAKPNANNRMAIMP